MQGSTELYPPLNVTEFSFIVAAMLLSILAMTVFVSNAVNVLVALQFNGDVKHTRAMQEYRYRHQVSTDLAEIVREHVEVQMRVDRKLLAAWGRRCHGVFAYRPATRALQEVRRRMIKSKKSCLCGFEDSPIEHL